MNSNIQGQNVQNTTKMNGVPQTNTLQNSNSLNQPQPYRDSSQINPTGLAIHSPNNSQINQPNTSQIQSNISPVQNQNFNTMQLSSPKNSNIKPNLNY